MVGLRTEMDRLNHTDVRQRRIALRRLKDLDDPAALPAFLPLLGSDDAWFRSHALDAIERWASLEDQTVLNACLEEGSVEAKLLTLHLLDTWGLVQDRRLMDLSADEVEEVAVRAWAIRMACAEPPWESASVHPIPRVRALAMRSEAPRGILERGTGDASSSVRRAALVAMIDRTGEADIVIQGLDRAGLHAMMLRLEALPIDVAKEVIERVANEHPSDAARAVDAALRLDVEGKEALLGSSRSHPHLHTRLLLKLRGQRWDDHRWRALESNKASLEHWSSLLDRVLRSESPIHAPRIEALLTHHGEGPRHERLVRSLRNLQSTPSSTEPRLD